MSETTVSDTSKTRVLLREPKVQRIHPRRIHPILWYVQLLTSATALAKSCMDFCFESEELGLRLIEVMQLQTSSKYCHRGHIAEDSTKKGYIY